MLGMIEQYLASGSFKKRDELLFGKHPVQRDSDAVCRKDRNIAYEPLIAVLADNGELIPTVGTLRNISTEALYIFAEFVICSMYLR